MNLNHKVNQFAVVLTLLTAVTVGCSNHKGAGNGAATATAESPVANSAQDHVLPKSEVPLYEAKCKKPEVFNAPDSEPLSADSLLNSFGGDYELDEVHIHQSASLADGTYVGAFYGIATRYIGNETFMGATNIRETKLTQECQEYNDKSGVYYFSGVSIPIASFVHFPSGRITVFDEGHHLDNPAFNLPSLAEIHFDAVGFAHYKVAVGLSGPPYIMDRYFKEVLAKYSSEPKIYRRSNGGFELRLSWAEQKQVLNGTPYSAQTEVVITYKREE